MKKPEGVRSFERVYKKRRDIAKANRNKNKIIEKAWKEKAKIAFRFLSTKRVLITEGMKVVG